jgi:hypothetical protein
MATPDDIDDDDGPLDAEELAISHVLSTMADEAFGQTTTGQLDRYKWRVEPNSVCWALDTVTGEKRPVIFPQ